MEVKIITSSNKLYKKANYKDENKKAKSYEIIYSIPFFLLPTDILDAGLKLLSFWVSIFNSRKRNHNINQIH